MSQYLQGDLRNEDERDGSPDVSSDNLSGVVRFSVLLGFLASLLAIVVAYFSYHASFTSMEEKYQRFYLDKARALVHVLEAAGPMTEAQVLEEIDVVWNLDNDKSLDEYICVVDANGDLVLHSAHPDTVGNYAGDNRVMGKGGAPVLRNLKDVVRVQDEYIGEYVSSSGEEQLAAFVPMPRQQWVLGVHRSLGALRAEIVSGYFPLLVGLLVICGVLFPASFFFLYRNILISVRKQKVSESRMMEAYRQIEENSKELELAYDRQVAHEVEMNATYQQLKASEITIRDSENKYRQLVESANSIILRLDSLGRIVFMNEYAERFFKFSLEACMGHSVFDSFIPRIDSAGIDLEVFFTNLCAAPESYPSSETEILTRDGEQKWVVWSNKAVLNDNKDVLGVLCVGNDVTARKHAEDALQLILEGTSGASGSAFFRNLVSCLARSLRCRVAMVSEIIESERKCVRTMAVWKNGAIVENFEYCLEGSPCANVLEEERCYFPDKVQERFPDHTVLARMGVESYMGATLRDLSGRALGVLVLMDDKPMQGVELAEMLLRIFSTRAGMELERVRAGEEQARLSTAIEQAAEMVLITDVDGVILYVNPVFGECTGYSAEEALGQTPHFLKSGRHDVSFYSDMWERLKRGYVWSGRLVNQRKDGELIHVEATISPVRDSEGETVNFVAVERDVTHEAALETQVRQKQKMEAIGALAGGIAHDFNNILQGIMGYADLALLDLEDGSEPQFCVQEVLAAGGRARELVAQILTFSRQGDMVLKPVNLLSVARETLQFLRGSLPASMVLEESLSEECGFVWGDPTQFHQVLMNLCTNAYQAMGEKNGTLALDLREAFFSEARETRFGTMPEGGYACISVKDTGEGMDERTIKRIFEPYFTTKDPGRGTGLGLATVLGIIQSANGFVDVESEVGKGTEFKLFFPIFVPDAVGTVEERQPERVDVEGTERILLVDDEYAIVEQAQIGLERLGYSVDVRTSSLDALELIRNEPRRFDVVVTDQVMPNLEGLDLAGKIVAIRSDLPIVLCTGYSDNITAEAIKRSSIVALVRKPIVARQLAEAIRSVL